MKLNFMPVTELPFFFFKFHFHYSLVDKLSKWPYIQYVQSIGSLWPGQNKSSDHPEINAQRMIFSEGWCHECGVYWGLTLKGKNWVFANSGPFLVTLGALAACEHMWFLKNAKNLALKALAMRDLRIKLFSPHDAMHLCFLVLPQSQTLWGAKSSVSLCGPQRSEAFWCLRNRMKE